MKSKKFVSKDEQDLLEESYNEEVEVKPTKAPAPKAAQAGKQAVASKPLNSPHLKANFVKAKETHLDEPEAEEEEEVVPQKKAQNGKPAQAKPQVQQPAKLAAPATKAPAQPAKPAVQQKAAAPAKAAPAQKAVQQKEAPASRKDSHSQNEKSQPASRKESALQEQPSRKSSQNHAQKQTSVPKTGKHVAPKLHDDNISASSEELVLEDEPQVKKVQAKQPVKAQPAPQHKPAPQAVAAKPAHAAPAQKKAPVEAHHDSSHKNGKQVKTATLAKAEAHKYSKKEEQVIKDDSEEEQNEEEEAEEVEAEEAEEVEAEEENGMEVEQEEEEPAPPKKQPAQKPQFTAPQPQQGKYQAQNNKFEKKQFGNDRAPQFEVFVVSLPFDITEEEIREHFGECPDLTQVKMLYRDESFNGKCFLKFATEEGQAAALELNGSTVKNRSIIVERPKADNERGQAKPGQLRNTFGDNQGQKSSSVIVRNLPYTITEDTLRDNFSGCGNIKGARLMTNPDGSLKGFGFIDFYDEEAAAKALKKTNSYIQGRAIDVQYAIRRENQGEGRGGFGGGRGGRGGFGGGRGGRGGFNNERTGVIGKTEKPTVVEFD